MEIDKLKSLFISPRTSIKQSMYKLNETAEKILFVVDAKDRFIGTVTDGDIRRGIMDGLSFSSLIENIMNKNFLALKSNMLNFEIIERAKTVMMENKIEQIPIVNDSGMIVDVVLWRDIVQEKKLLSGPELLSNPVVIMAGGKGKRLDPYTRILPKPLIPLGNKSVVELIMGGFYRWGFHRFIYTLNYKKEYIKLFLKEINLPYEISWVEETDYLGTAGSLALLKDKVKETFFVTNCDILFLDVNFKNILAWHKQQKAAITVVASHREFRIQYGVLKISEHKLEGITEKPVHDLLVNTGVYLFEPHILSRIPEGKKLEMNKLIESAIKKEKVSVYPIYNGWFDVGQWEDYEETLENIKTLRRDI